MVAFPAAGDVSVVLDVSCLVPRITVVNRSGEVLFESAGAQLFARVRGGGQPVVLLHGSGLTTHASLKALSADLAPWAQVITCDVRGFGKSVSVDPAAHTWKQYALDVVALLDHLHLSGAVVGGFSMGAAIALVTALEHPDRVTGLVLGQVAFAGSEIGRDPAQDRLWASTTDLLRRARAQGLESALTDGAATAEAAVIREALSHHDGISLLAAHEGELQTAQPIPNLEVLRQVNVPTLLMPGADETHPVRTSHLYAQHLPRVTLGPDAAAAPADQAAAIRALLEALAP